MYFGTTPSSLPRCTGFRVPIFAASMTRTSASRCASDTSLSGGGFPTSGRYESISTGGFFVMSRSSHSLCPSRASDAYANHSKWIAAFSGSVSGLGSAGGAAGAADADALADGGVAVAVETAVGFAVAEAAGPADGLEDEGSQAASRSASTIGSWEERMSRSPYTDCPESGRGALTRSSTPTMPIVYAASARC